MARRAYRGGTGPVSYEYIRIWAPRVSGGVVEASPLVPGEEQQVCQTSLHVQLRAGADLRMGTMP